MHSRAALFLLCSLTSASTLAALNPGDVAFVGYNADDPDEFAFVALANIPTSESIFFTDNGWTAAGAFRTNEGVIRWTPSTVVRAGTVVVILPGSSASTGTLSTISGTLAFAAAGDQVIAFQGTVAEPTPIAALNMDGAWATDATTSNESALPTGLTEGVHALAIIPEVDNAAYNCSVQADTIDNIRTAVHTLGNWAVDDSVRQALGNCTFSITMVCGDSVATGSEPCDGNDFIGQSCVDDGYSNPTGLACSAGCDAIDTTGCAPTCDGALLEPDEVCDGTFLGGADCTDFDYIAPDGLGCSATCAFDLSGCTAECGNSVREPGEECDDGNETATCDSDCTAVSCGDGRCNAAANEDLTTCPADCAPVCGDDFAAGDEVCDGVDLRGFDCTDQGFDDGVLACNGNCDGFVTTACVYTCGNNSADGAEVCDGTDLDGVDCTDFNYTNAAGLGCATSCGEFDLSGCAPTCDGVALEPDEICDGTFLGGADCTDFDYVAPDGLACNATCTFDLSGCTAECGNSVREPGEECDDGNETATCDSDCTTVSCGDERCNATASEDLDTCLLDCAPAGYFKVAIIAYNADDPDQFSFLALTPLPTGLVLRFTDNGWLAAGGFRGGEGTLVWTADVDIAAGTEITVSPGSPPSASYGVVTSGGGSFALAATGDQLFVYRGDPAAPEFLFGLQMNGDWNADAANTNESALPPNLTLGVNALALVPEVDNAAYACGITTGNAESLSILISTPANWLTSDTVLFTQPLGCGFDVQVGDVCGDSVSTGSELCDGTDTAEASCVSEGFDAGQLGCNGTCDGYDTSACTYTCGNDVIGGAEICDGTALGGEDCTDYGYSEAAGLACANDCSAIVTSGCSSTCGDTVIEPGEDCDNGGTEAADCDLDCTTPTCGDGLCNALAAETAASCAADCPAVCGDGVVGGAETCDDGNTDSGDGCGAACAIEASWLCSGAPSVCVRDQDGDTIPDSTDNCPAVANADQADADADGIGDVCESPYVPSSGPATDDGCGCSTSRASSSWLGLALGAGLLWLRRRRRAG